VASVKDYFKCCTDIKLKALNHILRQLFLLKEFLLTAVGDIPFGEYGMNSCLTGVHIPLNKRE
jgi:hypothetical protein